MKLALALAALSCCAQNFSSRGFVESYTTAYPRAAANDSGHVVSEALLRYEASWEPWSWLKLSGALDARADTHRLVDRGGRFNWDDRSILRPAFSLRRLSLLANRGNWTFEAGRQLIRWGKADILNPTDRFAPRDFLNVVGTDFLGVTAARVTYENGPNSIDLVWQPWFTPSRTPLVNQRWTVLPAAFAGFRLRDLGARYPARSQFGARWNYTGSRYEVSLSCFDGFNHLPLFTPLRGLTAFDAPFERTYPRLRLYGADAALPTRFVTLKAEAAYYTAPKAGTDEYLLYVVQLERNAGEWVLAGGYAGEVVTTAAPNLLQFSPERGFARSFLGRAAYTISPSKSLAFSGAVRHNGEGTWLRLEYSQTYGRHWRATGGITWIHGDPADFLGQYLRNSYASLALRYSF